ncbi:MAG: hypothetical protein JWO52_2435 [Gammaproteobacteria bacterium]|jgi:hypothetical protein|nr:hypothetical protein [Gammaproteobacteria bacterium]
MWEVSWTGVQSVWLLEIAGGLGETRAFGQELSGSRCRRFRRLSLHILRPVHETSGSVHETSDNDTYGSACLQLQLGLTLGQDSQLAAGCFKLNSA